MNSHILNALIVVACLFCNGLFIGKQTYNLVATKHPTFNNPSKMADVRIAQRKAGRSKVSSQSPPPPSSYNIKQLTNEMLKTKKNDHHIVVILFNSG